MRVDVGTSGSIVRIERKADRHAIFGVVVVVGDADVEIAVDIGEPAGAVVGPAAGVGQVCP